MHRVWLGHLASSLDLALFVRAVSALRSLLLQSCFAHLYFAVDHSLVALFLRGVSAWLRRVTTLTSSAQIQLGNPTHVHPTRPLPFFGIACLVFNAIAFVVHAMTDFRRASRRGLLLDFVGQGALSAALRACLSHGSLPAARG